MLIKFSNAIIFCVAALLLGCANTTEISENLELEKAFPYSFSEKNLEGKKTYLFEWHAKDYLETERKTKGVELKTPPMTGLKEQTVCFEFLIRDRDFLSDARQTIIMQYHGIPDFSLGETWRNPITALVMRAGGIRYDFRASRERVTPKIGGQWAYTSKDGIDLSPPMVGSWNRVKIHQIFDLYNRGLVEVTFNGHFYSKNNINLGFNDQVGPYLKFGMYLPGSSERSEKKIEFRNLGFDNNCLGS